jgi:arabinofuranosyltransferase
LAIGLCGFLAFEHRWVCDDAFISFRYARHLVEGLGLRFNASEMPPVEGYSNLAWILALAPFEALGLDLVVPSRALSIGCAGTLIVLVARFAQRHFDASASFAAAAFLAVLPSTVLWATSGLETMAFALAVFATFVCVDGRRTTAAVACAIAATLLRADGALWAVAAVLAACSANRESARVAVRALTAVLATALLHALWRRWYHGDWLPNTAYAKTGASAFRAIRGVHYVISFVLAEPGVLVALAAGVLAARKRAPGLVAASCAMLALAAAWSIYLGGDFMPMGRFLVVATPFAAVLLAAAWSAMAEWRVLREVLLGALIVLALVPLFGGELAPASLRQHFHFRLNRPDAISEMEQWRAMRERERMWERAALAIAQHTRPGESMVLDAIGVVGYRTELELLDVFGLVSPEVARRGAEPIRASPGHDLRVDVEFFLDRKPDYVGAVILPVDAPPETGLPPGWSERSWASRLRVERKPIAGDAANELRLLRLDWGP